MQASAYRSATEHCDIITISVDDRDKGACVNSREIIAEVRKLIAAEITRQIMLKLSPIIETSLSGFTATTSNG